MSKTEIPYDSRTTFHKFGKNAVFNVAGFAVNTLCYMVITPFSLHILGKEKFGIWALTRVITSFAGFSSLGLDQALVKYVAEFWAQGKIDEISKTVSTAFVCFVIVAGGVASVLLISRDFLVGRLFRIPEQLQEEATFVVIGVVIIFFFNIVFSVYKSVLLGLQRMDITNGILVISRILSAIGVFFFLSRGFGLRGLVINSAIIAFLIICAYVFWVKKTIKGFSMSIFLFSVSHLKRILKYGMSIFLASIAHLSYDPVNKIALIHFASLSGVTFYEIGKRIQGMIYNVFGASLAPLLPAASELEGHKNTQGVEKLYLMTSRFILLVGCPVFMISILVAIPFVRVWLGSGYEVAGRTIQFLLVGYFPCLLLMPAYIISRGIGKPWLSTMESIVAAGINAIASISLTMIIGYYGVLVGTTLSYALSSTLLLSVFFKVTDFSFNRFLRSIPTGAVATVMGLGVLFFWLSSYINPWGWSTLIIVPTAFLSLYGTAVLALGFVNDGDRQMVVSVIKELRFFQKTD